MLRRDLRDAFHRARNVVFNRMLVVQHTQEVEEDAPLRVVVVHFDLLSDDALLLFDGLRRKIRGLDEVQQNLKRLICLLRAGIQVARRLKRSVRVRRRADLRIARKGIAVLAFKQFVLEEMRDTCRGYFIFRLIAAPESLVDRAVARTEQRVCAAHLRLGIYEDRQTGRVLYAPITVAEQFAFSYFHCVHSAAPSPFSI